ncbi:MAG TPA: efflux RND transporter permease subunit [Spirochaetota bacterium]|nr:efflux RND transporter permease subunit [Spirochaetota bacterium]
MEKFFVKFIRLLVNRPLLVNLLLIFIIITGAYSLYTMQRLGLPRVELYMTHITTIYPGASPEDVELNVTKKIETALESVSDIKKYTSVSMENMSFVTVEINASTDNLKEVQDDIERAVNRINDFPEEITDKPVFFEEKSDNWSIMSIGFSSNSKNGKEYVQLAKDLKEELLEVPQVSGIDIEGDYENEIVIKLKKSKLNEYIISIEEVINSIKSNKIRLSAGSLESFTTETGIVTLSEFETVEEIANIIVRINDAGNVIRLGDIATITKQIEEGDVIRKVNGHEGLWLEVIKQGNADILDTVNGINRVIERFKESRHIDETVDIIVLRDESIETRERLFILYTNAGIGLALVLILLFFFFSKRIAFWTSLGIPVAFATAFIVASLAGVSINRVSLLGLVVVLGMLVDDSIVVAENIHRHRLMGYNGKESAARGTAQVLIPVIGTVLTTVIAFVPIYFVPGLAFDFSKEIPTFVIAMLVGSLIESVFVLPVHLAHEKDDKETIEKDPFGMKLLHFMENAYERFLRRMLQHRYLSFGATLLIFAAALLLSLALTKFVMFPIDQATILTIYGETEPASSLSNTDSIISPVNDIIETLPDNVIKSYQTITGKKGRYSSRNLPNYFTFELTLTTSTERDMTALQVKDYIFSEIDKNGITKIETIDYEIDGGGPPAGKPVSIDVIGNDNEKRKKLISQIMKDLENIGLTEIDTDFREGKVEIRLAPDYELIARGDLSVGQVANVIRTAFDGTIVTYMETADEQIPFRVVLDKKDIDIEHPLRGLYTINNRGILIPVENLLRSQKGSTPQTVYRYNGKRKNTVTANIPDGMTSIEIYDKLGSLYTNFTKDNPGFRINLGGEAEESTNTRNKMIFATVLAIIGIYFVLVLQFNSLIQPAIVISAIPFGLIGILLAFGLQRIDLSMLALVGIMGYGGVVVNNSLILVEFINNERKSSDNSNFIENVVNGSKMRLTPIFLTTLTTVAGLMPTAYGWFGGMDSFISPMIMAMAWGLIIGTPAVLFVIPIQYAIIEDVVTFAKRITGIEPKESDFNNRPDSNLETKNNSIATRKNNLVYKKGGNR